MGIIGKEVADGVANFIGGLSYSVQFNLPYIALSDPVGSDFEAWSGLLWPYAGVGGATFPLWGSFPEDGLKPEVRMPLWWSPARFIKGFPIGT